MSPSRYDQARTISLDFDGVLATLVLGRAWEKARAGRKRIPLVSPFLHGMKTAVASLTEGLRRPLPHAEAVLRELRASQRTLYILTSRTGERIPAGERWLRKYGWTQIFDGFFFNTDGEDADSFKARTFGAQAIDVHVDDDAETLTRLARQFPDKLFIHMNFYRRKSPAAANIVAVNSWTEVAGLFQKDTAKPA